MTPASRHTLAELFAYYEQECLADAEITTRYGYQMFHRRMLREFGPMPLEDITPEFLRGWKQHFTPRCGPGTINRYMRMLSASLRAAVEDLRWLPEHPMARVRRPTVPEGVVRFLSPEERVALLNACQASWHPYLYAIVLLALSTGGRKDELRCLSWPAVDVESRVVRFLKTKTKQSRSVPLVGDALQVMRDLCFRRAPLVPWVFPHPSGRRPTVIETAWRAARLASGVQHFRFHDLRHTYASYLAMSGASLRVIADLLGHAKIQMTMRYSHLSPSYTQRVVEEMVGRFLV